MIVRKNKRVVVTVEMTEEQSTNLRTALKKAEEYATLDATREPFSKEEIEVMNDLRQSLLNS